MKVVMPHWCCVKAKRTIHLGAKTSRHATIVENQAILRVFVVRQRTWSEIILTTTKRLMITHSQHNMKRIWRRCVSGSWIKEHQIT